MFLRCIVPRNSWPCLKASSCCCLAALSVDLLFCFKAHRKHWQCRLPGEQRGRDTLCHRSLTPVSTQLVPAASWTSLRRLSLSWKVLVRFSAVKGEHLTSNTAYKTYNRFQVWEEPPQDIYMLPTFPNICFLKLQIDWENKKKKKVFCSLWRWTTVRIKTMLLHSY